MVAFSVYRAAYDVSAVLHAGSIPAVAVREAHGQYLVATQLPSEAVLSELWAGQRFPPEALLTIEGERVRVLHPGLKGRGAGPDYRHARIALSNALVLLGDVELHVRATDFRAHGHHHDARYDGVVLHVVFEDDIGANTLLSDGRRIPVIELAPWHRSRTANIAGWLERDNRWREPCHDAVGRLGQAGVVAVLETLGDQRFSERATVLGQDMDACGAGHALYQALLQGVNLGSERHVSRAVADALPWARIVPVLGNQTELEALLLGSAGLSSPEWSAPVAYSGRPANHPGRRLAGLARLLVSHRDLFCDLRKTRSSLDSLLQLTPAALIAEWTVAADEYWKRHVAPGQPAKRSPGALIGRGRAIELLTNAVLPWMMAAAERSGDRAGAERVHALFMELPAPGHYGRLAFLEQYLSEAGTSLKLIARRQQGLLALYQNECTQGGCGRCPLS